MVSVSPEASMIGAYTDLKSSNESFLTLTTLLYATQASVVSICFFMDSAETERPHIMQSNLTILTAIPVPSINVEVVEQYCSAPDD